jgi:hypothetical protein
MRWLQGSPVASPRDEKSLQEIITQSIQLIESFEGVWSRARNGDLTRFKLFLPRSAMYAARAIGSAVAAKIGSAGSEERWEP